MLGVNEIKDIIPHRYPFLLVDRVTEIVDGVSIKGYKNVSSNEPFFNGHFPTYPVMPGVLLGAVAVLSKDEFKGKIGFLVGADKVRWKKQVVPGDKLELEVEIIKMKGSIGVGKGVAKVDGKKVCEGEIMFAIGDA